MVLRHRARNRFLETRVGDCGRPGRRLMDRESAKHVLLFATRLSMAGLYIMTSASSRLTNHTVSPRLAATDRSESAWVLPSVSLASADYNSGCALFWSVGLIMGQQIAVGTSGTKSASLTTSSSSRLRVRRSFHNRRLVPTGKPALPVRSGFHQRRLEGQLGVSQTVLQSKVLSIASGPGPFCRGMFTPRLWTNVSGTNFVSNVPTLMTIPLLPKEESIRGEMIWETKHL